MRRARCLKRIQVVVSSIQFNKEASQARGYCVAEVPRYTRDFGARLGRRANALTSRARPDPSLRNKRLLGMTIRLMTIKLARYTMSSY